MAHPAVTFITRYLAHVGRTEVPDEYHRWCCYSLLAAAVQDHVWMTKLHERLYPNLYVFLIGPSGIGKDTAIATALRLAKPFPGLHVYEGKLTCQFLVDHLAPKPGMHKVSQDAKVYLVMTEGSHGLGEGAQARDTIKLLTSLYAGVDRPWSDGTRSHGEVTFRGHCINFIAASTPEWLRDSVPRDAVRGGFFGRICTVTAAYDFARRIHRPQPVEGYERLVDEMRQHLGRLVQLHGEVVMTPRAIALDEQWYCGRPAPDDPGEAAVWKREHDLCLKLAMGQALAEDGLALVVDEGHLREAQRLVAWSTGNHPALVAFISLGYEAEGLQRVRDAIREAGTLHESALVRAMTRYGMTWEKVRLYVETLTQSHEVHRAAGKMLRWTGRHSWSPDTIDDSDA